ncbi:MAG: hypothetical protein LBP64_01565 [Tannerella sp.]|jgi:hypothetical protein|nr:hypothetical protein [Tannerella sp.]
MKKITFKLGGNIHQSNQAGDKKVELSLEALNGVNTISKYYEQNTDYKFDIDAREKMFFNIWLSSLALLADEKDNVMIDSVKKFINEAPPKEST